MCSPGKRELLKGILMLTDFAHVADEISEGEAYANMARAREEPLPLNAELAIEGIAKLLQGNDPDFSDVSLDAGSVPAFNRRVYEYACTIPRGGDAHLSRDRQGIAPHIRWRRRSRKIPT
jgi:O6-methylguanine-DNA--protein-cysteine methyltransferase